MGDIADDMINGDFDFYTGEYIGEGHGIPRTHDKSLPWEKGKSNSVKKKNTSIPKHGGSHLIGRNIYSQKHGHCIIEDYGGRREKKRYIVRDSNGKTHKLKLSEFKLN